MKIKELLEIQNNEREIQQSIYNDLYETGTCVFLKMSEVCALQLKKWCKSQNLPCIDTDELHLTVLYSRKSVPHLQELHNNSVKIVAKVVDWIKLGERCLCLHLDCKSAHDLHQSFILQGGTHDYPGYIAHTTINYDWCTPTLPTTIPDFEIVFDKIVVESLDENYDTPRAT